MSTNNIVCFVHSLCVTYIRMRIRQFVHNFSKVQGRPPNYAVYEAKPFHACKNVIVNVSGIELALLPC